MNQWFLLNEKNEKEGPLHSSEVIDLLKDHKLSIHSHMWKNGFQSWTKIKDIPEFSEKTHTHELPTEIITGVRQTVIKDLTEINFKEEVIPLNSDNLKNMSKDFIFWSVSFLAVMPLFIVTLEKINYQLVGFALFFAFLWGVIFKQFIVKSDPPWKYLILSMFTTGLLGIELLLLFHDILPDFYNGLTRDKNIMIQLAGSILHTGILEEFCKILPVLFYFYRTKNKANPKHAILIGIFSGLGFAAFENLHYSDVSAASSLRYANREGVAGVIYGTISAQVNVMLRALSLVFLHAVFTGIFSYFISVAFVSNSRKLALFIVGLFVSATIHGCYNWFHSIQGTFSALICAFAFMLFYSYLTKLNQILSRKDN